MTRSKTSPRGSSKNAAPPPPTWDEKLINRLMPYRLEIFGIILFLFAAITILALAGFTSSSWLNWWTSLLTQTFGWGAYALSLVLAGAGIYLILRRAQHVFHLHPRQVIGLELLILTALPLTHMFSGATLFDAYEGKGGGVVGWALSEPLLEILGPILTGALYILLFAWGLWLTLNMRVEKVHRFLWRMSQHLRNWGLRLAPGERRKVRRMKPVTITQAPSAATPRQSANLPATPMPPVSRQGGYTELPPLAILNKGKPMSESDAEIARKKRIIEETLADFGLPAEVTQIRRGPAVTQYGVTPGYIERTGPDGEIQQKKVRIGQIAALRRDLALALAVPRLRIQAPVPGRGVVGVEVPNAQISLVRLRDIITSDDFQQLKAPLGVGLGRDVSGTAMAVDLSKMPHLLIAGTTGSGKSICLNAFITCLVFNNTPETLNLIMIDPKKVELAHFNGLPHLIGPVEVDADRAVGVLRWLTAEMDRRYEEFSKVGARNLGGYNRRAASRDNELEKMPYIAVFIDELADLMYMYPGDVERTLCRLAQMARATGIHLVVATQRPSTDVITGLIKANFPSRLSFAVASSIDSRVILDSVGADQLLGRGDGLFLSSDSGSPSRIQGVFVSDDEIDRVVAHWKQKRPDHVPGDPPWETLIAKYALLDETDSLLESAIELAQKNDTISASLLQRRLRLGYPRAARLMEHLYEMGLVEDPKTGGKTRKTYTEEGEDPLERFLSEK